MAHFLLFRKMCVTLLRPQRRELRKRRGAGRGIASHFVKTWPSFEAEHLEQCKAVLAVEDGPYHLHTKDGYDRTVLDTWRKDTYGK